jgi:hypothetical protein
MHQPNIMINTSYFRDLKSVKDFVLWDWCQEMLEQNFKINPQSR